jgi:hypothetical protein
MANNPDFVGTRADVPSTAKLASGRGVGACGFKGILWLLLIM